MPAARLVIQKTCSPIRTGSWSGRGVVATTSRRGESSRSSTRWRSPSASWSPARSRRRAHRAVADDDAPGEDEGGERGGDDALADAPRCGGPERRGVRGREGMPSSRGDRRERAVRTLRGSWAMPTTVIFDLDGVLVDSRAVVPVLRQLRVRQARPARARATRSCCPTSARRSRTRFGELLGVPARRADRRPPASTATASATRTPR